jgi:hypothetical protein
MKFIVHESPVRRGDSNYLVRGLTLRRLVWKARWSSSGSSDSKVICLSCAVSRSEPMAWRSVMLFHFVRMGPQWRDWFASLGGGS